MSKEDAPKNMREFEDRLGHVYQSYYEKVIGLAHYVGSGKTIKRNVSEDLLVDLLIALEKKGPINIQMSPLNFLRVSLEKDGPLGESDYYLLGKLRWSQSSRQKIANFKLISLIC